MPVGGEDALRREQTTAFTTFVLFEFCDVLNSVSQRKSLWQRHRNPWLLGALAVSLALHAAVICWPPLQQAFRTVPLAAVDWGFTAAVAASVIVVVELVKRTRAVRG